MRNHELLALLMRYQTACDKMRSSVVLTPFNADKLPLTIAEVEEVIADPHANTPLYKRGHLQKHNGYQLFHGHYVRERASLGTESVTYDAWLDVYYDVYQPAVEALCRHIDRLWREQHGYTPLSPHTVWRQDEHT